ncbi:MAG: PEP-CTERM sorting domain-containing protein, partial [Crocosphaera sp.]
AIFPVTSATGTFGNFMADVPPIDGTQASGSFDLLNNLVFEFDSGIVGDPTDNVVATLRADAEFEGELLEDDAVEFELLLGEWEFFLPATDEFDEKTLFAESSILEFGQSAGSIGGGYVAEGTDIKVPEPASLLGLLAVGGLGLGLKRKKQ